MAVSTKKENLRAGSGKKKALIDPIYQKYTKSVIRALGSTEFYEFFMNAVSGADNRFQFSNRRMEKIVDLEWVDAIEDTLPAFQSILSAPRNIIREDEVIVNVANAKKAGADVVRHLAQHASMVEKFDDRTGEVRPSKLMQKYREDSVGVYENRLVYTALDVAYQFVKIRHDALFSAMSDEFGAKLKVDSNMESDTETVHMDMFLHIREKDSILETDAKNSDTFERISRIYRLLQMMMGSAFVQEMSAMPRVRGAITKTNVLKKNPSYRKVVALFEFLQNYQDIGYTIRVIEQNPQIDERLQQDIYHNIMFNYLILKGYLEDEKDREVPAPAKTRKRALKPKFIKEIIEELTEDYDLPDVEVRKVLIEELTKEQLMLEEAEERRRLVEEQERRKREEEERLRREEEERQEQLRREQEAEEERLRLEREAEENRLRTERMIREAEDRRRCKIFREELEYFQSQREEQLKAREAALRKRLEEQHAAEEAARILAEAEQRKKEAEERERIRIEEEKERIRREKELEAERVRQEEERIRREEEELKERLQREQAERDTARTDPYREELARFESERAGQLALRKADAEERRLEQAERERERLRRQELRAAKIRI